MDKLPQEFYLRNDVIQISKELLGKVFVTNIDRQYTAGRIVEVEAYNGIIDKASHAYNNRRTKRTETMFKKGGISYVYLCYGIHHLFNIVTNKIGIPHAILLRGIEPIEGMDEMLKRTSKNKMDTSLTKGPGNLSKAFGISALANGIKLTESLIYIADDGVSFSKIKIGISPRIGVDYAGDDALLPYRFYKKDNPFVSGKPK